ncbi:unnamed protein product, partial [Prorocentrum cordatum]
VNYIGAGVVSPRSSPMRAGSFPASPGVPEITSRTLTSANLRWSAPASLGAGIDTYRLFMSGPDDGGFFEEVYSGPDISFTKAALTPGMVYQFRVSAVNVIGEGPPSAVRQASACGGGGASARRERAGARSRAPIAWPRRCMWALTLLLGS